MAYSDKQKEEIFEKICLLIEKGGALRTILRDKDMPSSQTFFIWMDNDIDKSKRYARATDLRTDELVEQILEISDDQEGDTYTDADGNEQINHNVIQRARLRVDSRKWLAGKLRPKKYGDSSKVVIDGGIEVTTKTDFSNYSDEDLATVTKVAEKYILKKK